MGREGEQEGREGEQVTGGERGGTRGERVGNKRGKRGNNRGRGGTRGERGGTRVEQEGREGEQENKGMEFLWLLQVAIECPDTDQPFLLLHKQETREFSGLHRGSELTWHPTMLSQPGNLKSQQATSEDCGHPHTYLNSLLTRSFVYMRAHTYTCTTLHTPFEP